MVGTGYTKPSASERSVGNEVARNFVRAGGRSRPAGDRNSKGEVLAGLNELLSRNLVSREGEPFHLPVSIPCKVVGNIGSVDFNGEGHLNIGGYPDDAHARLNNVREWKLPGKDLPYDFEFIDKKEGRLFSYVIDDIEGWWRAKMPGRIGSTTGVNILFVPRSRNALPAVEGGWVFFDAGKYNNLLEFALNKRMGWTIFDTDLLWAILTSDTVAFGWPKEVIGTNKDKKINVREHFFTNGLNRRMLVGYARGRMGFDPAKKNRLSDIRARRGYLDAEEMWVARYQGYASAIERFVLFDHPETANLFPDTTADIMATAAVNLRATMDFDRPEYEDRDGKLLYEKLYLETKVDVFEVADSGNLVGIGESYWATKGSVVLCPEDAVDSLVNARRIDIDNPRWLKYDSGIDVVNRRNEFYELLLAGRALDAFNVLNQVHVLYDRYLRDKAKYEMWGGDAIDQSKFGHDWLMKDNNWYENYQMMVNDKLDLFADLRLLTFYVKAAVDRGQWKPVNVTPLRIGAPQNVSA